MIGFKWIREREHICDKTAKVGIGCHKEEEKDSHYRQSNEQCQAYTHSEGVFYQLLLVFSERQERFDEDPHSSKYPKRCRELWDDNLEEVVHILHTSCIEHTYDDIYQEWQYLLREIVIIIVYICYEYEQKRHNPLDKGVGYLLGSYHLHQWNE